MALNGKTAVVTGAAMGIGKAVTEILLENGAKVVLLDVNEAAAETLLDQLQTKYGQDRTLFLKCNIESEEQIKGEIFNSTTLQVNGTSGEVEALRGGAGRGGGRGGQTTIETFGRFDILFNNASILDEMDWRKTVSINLVGVISGTYLALEHMNNLTGGQGGVIINMVSTTGVYAVGACPVYTASKHGVVGFTRSMAITSILEGYGTRLNAICPGPVQTDLLKASRLGQFSHMQFPSHEILTMMGILIVSDVAEAVLELVMDETKSGEALVILGERKAILHFFYDVAPTPAASRAAAAIQ